MAILHGGAAPDAMAEAASPSPPIESFFENRAFSDPQFSPNGRYVAARKSLKGQRDHLVVVELDSLEMKAVAGYKDVDIGRFQWVNNDRLVFDVRDSTQTDADQDDGPGLFAVDRDGSNFVQLANRNSRQLSPQPWNTFMMSQRGSQDSDWIYVLRPIYGNDWKYIGTRLRYLNTRTGVAKVAPEPDVEVSEFMLDFKGEPRLAISYTDINTSIYYRDPVTDQWRMLVSYASYNNAREKVEPLGFGPSGALYVVANAGRDIATLRTFDFSAGAVSREEVVVAPGYDFVGSLVTSGKVLGVRMMTDAQENVWFDAGMKAIQAAVDKGLPSTVNLLIVPPYPGSPWVMVEAYSDMQPSRFILFNTQTEQLIPLGSTYPAVQGKRLAVQEVIRFKARDGLEIPGLLTLPAGVTAARLPMVVLVHGGPWVRGGSWGWDPQSQFLASRGYAVLEVEFRGSTGFGLKHFEAGLKQWGLAMQNDIADGTRWAIAKGYADPKRICIAGASYGGYAALMGLVNDPDLYRCAFEWLGVTDIELMYTGTWFSKSDASPGYLRYGMPVMIGDRVKDAEQLKATSPIKQAARIHQPLLLAYGGEDKRVPIHHGKKFRSAVTRTNEQVEWVEYSDEGHGWSLPKNRIDFWGRVEKFLHQHIGQPAEAPQATK
jgi:dipeptidyl aminopeptidase/acylaminoacyl peptidase